MPDFAATIPHFVSMDANHVQRSASHGSLRSSYKSETRPGRALSRRPLRSVKGNASSLLTSPGPLESMLKTTTETGDIGIFTIKTIAPATTLHQCARSRPGIDASSIFRSESRSSIRTKSRFSRGRRGSDRDTNSEIFSLYGSEGNPSGHRSRSPGPRADPFRRSYSKTATGQSGLRHQRSSRTLQSQSSGILQRPRSPFPYPTRLKRPGVRPSSPAITESGRVDYSRMVELDRISSRTVHGSYKPAYPNTRLAPPVSFRPGMNHSMPSLPHGDSRMVQLGQSGRDHGQWTSPAGNWNYGRVGTFRRPATDQSMRSSSLTSVINMYCTPGSASETNSPRTLHPVGSFYYDYTEGFESSEKSAGGSSSEPPVAPIPQRASSLVKALVLRDEAKARLDAVVDISVKDSSESSGELNPVAGNSTPSQAQDNDSEEILPILAPLPFEKLGSSTSGAAADVKQRQSFDLFSYFSEDADIQVPFVSEKTPTPKGRKPSPVGDLETDQAIDSSSKEAGFPSHLAVQSASTHGTLRKSPSAPATSNVESGRISSQGGLAALLRSSLRPSVEPCLSDLASLVSSFERIAKSPFMWKDKETAAENEDATHLKPSHPSPVEDNIAALVTNHETNPESQSENGLAKGFSKGHRRNQAVARISTKSLRSTTPTSFRSANTTILCPEPVSPICQLRIRNSIPQLMKALPNLPVDLASRCPHDSVAFAEDDRFPVKLAPFQLEILATPRSSPGVTKGHSSEDHESLRASIELDTESGRTSTDQQSVENNNSAEIAIIKTRKALAPSQLAEENFSEAAGDSEKKSSPRRLRLRSSKRLLAIDGCIDTKEDAVGTVRRQKGFSGHNNFKDIVEDPSENLLRPAQRNRSHVDKVYQRKGRQFRLVTPSARGNLQPFHSHANPRTYDGYVNDNYIPLAHPVDENLRSSSSFEGYGLSDSRSFSSDLAFIRPRILRKKLSHFKIRMTRSRMNLRGRNIGSAASDATVRPHGQRDLEGPAQTKRMGRRVKGWFRRAVHIVIKRR